MLKNSCSSVDTVFINVGGVDEFFVTFNLFDACRRSASIKHLVYLSGCGASESGPASWYVKEAMGEKLKTWDAKCGFIPSSGSPFD